MAPEPVALPPRYARVRPIASGGMADIYTAEDTELGRRVAVKVLAERFAEDQDIRERFKRESLTAARLSGNPHVATIYDVGEVDGRPFIVLELLAGGTVADRLREGAVNPDQALLWLEQAASALDAAHAEGIVHRDVKPANMLLDDEDEVHVSDFGIARVLDEAAEGITATGTILGTAGYLSPEQARGGEATPASDVYGLGVVAYELLTGRRPFERSTMTAEAAAHVHEPVPPASEQADLPPAVDAVFARALAKDPAYRYGSAEELVDDLGGALVGRVPVAVAAAPPAEAPTVQLRRRRVVPSRRVLGPSLAGTLLVAGGIFAAVLLSNSNGPGPAPAPANTRAPSSSSQRAPVAPPPVLPAHEKKEKGEKGDKGKGKKKGHFKHGKEKGEERGEEGGTATTTETTEPVTTETVPATTETLPTTTASATTAALTTGTAPTSP